MINDEIDHINIVAKNFAEETVAKTVNPNGNQCDELLSKQSERHGDKGTQSKTSGIPFRTEDVNEDNEKPCKVSNIESCQQSTTEESNERSSISSENFSTWKTHPNAPFSWSQKSKRTYNNLLDVPGKSPTGVDLDKREGLSSSKKSLYGSEAQRRANVDLNNSRLLDNNLKLLKSKCEESQVNKTFDCSNRLLEIKKLYNENSRNDRESCSIPVTKLERVDSKRSISFRETFTNLIQGCNYFENKRLIPSGFKTDHASCEPGAFINDVDDGNDSGDSIQTVNICKNSEALNQNNVNTQFLDEFKISFKEQIQNNAKTSEQIKKTNIEQTNANHSKEDNLNHTAHKKLTFDEHDVSIEKGTVFNSTEQSTILDTSDAIDKLLDKSTGENWNFTGDNNTSAASNDKERDILNCDFIVSGEESNISTNDADDGQLDASGFNISPEELLESLQLSQTSEELLESVGDQPDCLFHLTNDGSQGCDNIRLRVMMPALNKVLCSNRVSQMTRTYHDIEAVTRLLEEKEKDLELTARIGKELLATNQKLENTVAALDSELKTANESITQLHYELGQKNDLLTILTNDVQDDDDEAEAANTSGAGPGSMQYEVLQRKIGFLERENRSLRDETDSLCATTDEVEAAEQRLVEDLAAQLSYAQSEVAMIEEDLNRTRAELSDLKTQNQALVDKLSSAEEKVAQVSQNNTEMSLVVQLARETQCELAQELAEMKEKYAEVLSILSETQELLKRNKKRSIAGTSIGGYHGTLGGPGSHHMGPGPLNPDSLAAELECSLFSEFSLDSGIGGTIPRYKRVFDTVRCSSLHSGIATPHTTPSLYYESLGSSITTPSQTSHPLAYPGECPKGIPGIPGSADLEAALRRLTPGAVLARRTALSTGLSDYTASDCPATPDSVLSNDSSIGYSSASVRQLSQQQWKVPEKLQIVKPIEGSATLQHWSALATPSLSNILQDPQAGVKVRGSAYAPNPRTYTLEDVEEDDDGSFLGKQCETARHTYTYTNSLVKHPDSFTQVTPSMPHSRMSTAVNSRCSSLAPSRRNSISLGPSSGLNLSTSSSASPLGPAISLSLAKVLHEQGIQAASPSALGSPNFTPTATPCNSPYRSRESSPTRDGESSQSPSHSPPPTTSSSMYSPFGLPGYLVASGAELLRRALVGPMSRDTGRRARVQVPPPAASTGTGRALVGSNKALTNMSIVEQLEKIGLDNLVSSHSDGSTPAPDTPPARSRAGSENRPRVRADLGTVPFKGPSLGSLGAMRKGGLL